MNRRRRPHPLVREAYINPRRRRTDAITTAIIGFVVGAVLGLTLLGLIGFVSWLGTSLAATIGFVRFIVVVGAVGGITLAVAGYRSVIK